ncbi:hypothetical protein [Paenibacillus sp. GYB003]|uniref:hypothetical protein n=1 Tax=Paenibacillus sp. GYB003 TaxID=2994392 RepID=UPI002F96BB9F
MKTIFQFCYICFAVLFREENEKRNETDGGASGADFYDGSIMCDFARDRTRFCDFDLYAKGPFVLQAERIFGSSRFMAPEEFVKGSLIDNRTNVVAMGAAAFVFLAGGRREREAWRRRPSVRGCAEGGFAGPGEPIRQRGRVS